MEHHDALDDRKADAVSALFCGRGDLVEFREYFFSLRLGNLLPLIGYGDDDGVLRQRKRKADRCADGRILDRIVQKIQPHLL